MAFGTGRSVPAEAVIDAVADGTVFVARSDADHSIGAIRVVRDEAGVVGAVVLLFADGERIVGFAIEAALKRPLRVGDRIVGR